jgi:hypothetical protein
MSGVLSDIGTGIEDAFGSVSDGVDDLFESDKPYGESPDLDSYKRDAKYDPDTGEPLNEAAEKAEAEYDKFAAKEDSKYEDVLKAASKLGGAGAPGVIAKSGRLPGVNMPSVRGGRFTPQQSPYAAPSYLQGSQAYNSQVGKLVQTLLNSQIRGRSIRTLI